MSRAAELTRALGGRWYGRYGTARCVVHGDRNPSLSILIYASAWMVRVGLNPLMVGKVELPITNRFGISQDCP